MLYGQPSICEQPVNMTPLCNEACIICDIDGFTGRHDSDVRGEVPPGFCVITTENAQWLAFQAGSTSLTVDLSVNNCDNFFFFSGIQVGLYQSLDCINFTRISNCIGDLSQIRDGQTGRLETTVELEIGEYYYIVMDGASGDNCDWTFNVIEGSTAVDPLSTTGVIIAEDTICLGSPTRFSLDKEVGVTQFLWEINGDTVSSSNDLDTVFSLIDTYEVCVTGSNVCNQGPRICKEVVVRPPLFAQDSIFKCSNQCVQIQDSTLCEQGIYVFTLQGINGCDSIVEYVLTNWDTSITTIDTLLCADEIFQIDGIDFTEDTIYRQLRFTSNMCDSIIQYSIRFRAPIQSELDTGTCEGEVVVIEGQLLTEGINEVIVSSSVGCDSLLLIDLEIYPNSLFQIDTLICSGDTIEMGGHAFYEEGIYYLDFETFQSCDSIVEIQIGLLDCEIRAFQSVITPKKCYGDKEDVSFFIENGLGPLTYNWIAPGGDTLNSGLVSIGDELSFIGLTEGKYLFSLADKRGVVFDFVYESRSLDSLQSEAKLSDYGGFEVSCPGEFDGRLEVSSSGGVSPYSYIWRGVELESPILDSLPVGEYSIEVVDSLGCRDTLLLNFSSPSLPLVNIGEVQYPCNEDTFAFVHIEFDSLSSAGVLVYNGDRLDEGSLQISENGMKQINLEFGEGCVDSITFNVDRPPEVSLDLGDEIKIRVGDSIDLNTRIDIDLKGAFEWLGGEITCVNCLSYFVSPTVDRLYTLRYIPFEACPVEDSIWVRVDFGESIVFPNVFSPNRDNQNDLFYLYHPRIRAIEQIQIYSRWGNLVHSIQNPDEDYVGWDGSWNGETLNADVYVWTLSFYVFESNALQFLSGEVTLIR